MKKKSKKLDDTFEVKIINLIIQLQRTFDLELQTFTVRVNEIINSITDSEPFKNLVTKVCKEQLDIFWKEKAIPYHEEREKHEKDHQESHEKQNVFNERHHKMLEVYAKAIAEKLTGTSL